MTNFLNISERSRSPETQDTLWYWWLNGGINTITVLGNGMVILLILTRSSLRTTQNCFVLSLAVADFLVGSIAFPLDVLYYYSLPGNPFIVAIYNFLIYASTTNLCALTLDRYISIVHPLKHIHTTKKSNVIKTLMVAWLVAFVFPFLSLLLKLFVKSSDIIRIYKIFLLSVVETFPCICLPIAYFRILQFVRRQQALIKAQAKQLQHNYSMNNATEQNVKKNKMTIRVLGGVIGFFVISRVLFLIRTWMNIILTASITIPALATVSFLLLFANSSVNVFFYGIFKKDFRGEIVKLYTKSILRA